MKRQQRVGNDVMLAFGLPDFLGELKVGDRVALQLLWSPDGQEPLRTGEMYDRMKKMMRLHMIGWEWPVMTNRIEFTLTDELLAKRDNPIPQSAPRLK